MKTNFVSSLRRSIRPLLLLPSVLLLASSCVGADDDMTGSESHFVSCRVDADCSRGTCEESFCEVNGERVSRVETATVGQTPTSTAENDAATLGLTPEDSSDPYCEVLSRTPTTLEALGSSADDLDIPETTLPFTWGSADWGGYVAIEPEQADTDVTIEVTVLEDTAVHLERKQRPGVGGDHFCDSVDQVEMRYHLRTGNGMFDEEGDVTNTLGEEPHTLSFSVDAADLGGSLKVTPIAKNAEASFNFTIWWPEAELSGEVSTTIRFPDNGDGASSAGTASAPGRFSRTGCRPRYYYLGTDAQFGEQTLAEELAALSTPKTWLGSWDDSAETSEVTSTVTFEAMGGCYSANTLQLPMTMTLSSADGKLRDLQLEGLLNLLRAPDESRIDERQLTASTHLVCGESELWPVQNVNCADYPTVEASFVSNTYAGMPNQDGGSLELYLFALEGNTDASADKVTTLRLVPANEQ